MPDMLTASNIWRLCLDCAYAIYGASPPSTTAAHNCAQLLFGTAAAESDLIWNRQRTVRWDGKLGGFGKWQVEQESIKLSLHHLSKQPARLRRATEWLFADPRATDTWPSLMSLDAVLWALRLECTDRLGVFFARQHYLRVPDPIPHTIPDQAQYWKLHYNTTYGKGTPKRYLHTWRLHCESIVWP